MNRRSAFTALAAVVLALGGCSSMKSDSRIAGTAVHDGAMTIDLTHKPTRQELGYPAGQNWVTYSGSGANDIAVTVVLPTGKVTIPARDVVANDGHMFSDQDPDHLRPPLVIDIHRKFASLQAARDSLAADLPVFLIGGGVDVAAAQQAVRSGADFDFGTSRLRDWLDVGFGPDAPETDGSVEVTYEFGVDQWHSPSIDAVVHDGVFTADLTKLPSRADFGMRDTFSDAPISPYPGTSLAASLKLPTGTLSRPVGSVDGSSTSKTVTDPRGVGQPVSMTVYPALAKGEKTTLDMLAADAPLLGISMADVHAALERAQGAQPTPGQAVSSEAQHAVFKGLSNAVLDVTVNLDIIKTADGSWGAGGASYVFDFHR